MEKFKDVVKKLLFLKQHNSKHRDDKIVLFGAWFGERFADNSRYLYQYLSDNRDMLGLTHVVWVSRDEKIVEFLQLSGYEAYSMDSQESLYYHLVAGTHFICNLPNMNDSFKGDILGELSLGARRVNLWHGNAALKGVFCSSNEYENNKKNHYFRVCAKEFLHKKSKLFRVFFQEAGGWTECYYISPTRAENVIMKKTFLMPDKYYINTGYPRNFASEYILENEKKVIEIIRRFKTKILYLPTFRTGNNHYNFLTLAADIKDILERTDSLWIEKSHKADKENKNYLTGSSNVIRLSPDFDINILMKQVDLIITDYSSAMSDALYYMKDVMFYTPDYDVYMEGDRGFAINPKEIMCGPQYTTKQSFIKGIARYCEGERNIRTENYETARKKYWGKEKSMKEIWDDICQAIGL